MSVPDWNEKLMTGKMIYWYLLSSLIFQELERASNRFESCLSKSLFELVPVLNDYLPSLIYYLFRIFTLLLALCLSDCFRQNQITDLITWSFVLFSAEISQIKLIQRISNEAGSGGILFFICFYFPFIYLVKLFLLRQE